MVTLHPQILEHKGRKAFVVLSYEEFRRVEEELEDFEDLRALRAAKAEAADAPTTPLARVREKLRL